MKSTQRQQLKAKAHALKPVVLIGSHGLTQNVIEETNLALTAHELIKVKIYGMEREERNECAEQICQSLDAELVQSIGNTLVLYRKNPDKK